MGASFRTVLPSACRISPLTCGGRGPIVAQEGESCVLMQKLARDAVKRGAAAGAAAGAGAEERAITAELRGARAADWLAKSGKIYLLAELVMDRTMEQLCGTPLPRGIARPWARL